MIVDVAVDCLLYVCKAKMDILLVFVFVHMYTLPEVLLTPFRIRIG